MNNNAPQDVSQALATVFSKTFIDGIFYFFNRLDDYEKKQRYDDNPKKMLVNALRLFEQGQLTKEQLKIIVDLLPETKIVEAKSVQLPNISQDNNQPLDLQAILDKLSQQ